jgi:hypothetical protein
MGGDSQVSFAPDTAASPQPNDFDRQFQDAQQAEAEPRAPLKHPAKPSVPPRASKKVASPPDGMNMIVCVPTPATILPVSPLTPTFSFAPLMDYTAEPSGDGLKAPANPKSANRSDETPPVENTPAQAVSEDVAFAVRVQPQPAAPRAPSPSVNRPSTPVIPAREMSRPESEDDTTAVPPQPEHSHTQPLFLPPAEAAAPAPQPGATIETPKEVTPPTRIVEPAAPQAKPAEPLKQISIQVGQQPQERVDLRVIERSGELHVAVRAANPEVAQGLRQGLPELVGRLEQSGFRSEAWRPGGTVTAVEATAETRQKSTEFQQGGSGEQPPGREQQGQHSNPQRSRPQWVEEIEGITGELHGVSR